MHSNTNQFHITTSSYGRVNSTCVTSRLLGRAILMTSSVFMAIKELVIIGLGLVDGIVPYVEFLSLHADGHVERDIPKELG